MTYDAFISYSHAADDALAPAVQHALQTLARPWNRRRALEVFRDDTGLAVSPGLWTSICAGLDDSTRFVLLASPEAAESRWVNQEIERWVESHSIDRLLPVLTAGEWVWDPASGDFDWDRSTAVPPALRGRFREEPRHLDLRWARTETELDLRHSKFREAMAQLAAPMHDMSPQDLESSDVARFRHLVRLRRAVVAALCVLLLLVSVAGVIAVRNAREAQQQQAAAEQQARRALSLQLLAQGKVLANQQKTLGLLLTAEAARLTPAEARASLVSALDDTAGLVKVFDFPSGARASETPVAVDVGADIYASASHRGQAPVIRFWDLRTGQPSGKSLKHNSLYGLAATELAFGPDGTLAALYRCLGGVCAKDSGGIQLWDVETRRRSGPLLARSVGSTNMAFSHSGDRLAATAPDGVVHVWDAPSGRAEATYRPPPGQPTGLAFSPDDTMLALSQTHASHILVWDTNRPESSHPVDIGLPPGRYAEDIAFASGGVLVGRDDEGVVRLWRPDTGAPAGALDTGVTVVGLAPGPDGILATAGADGSVRLWDVERRQQIGSARPSGLHGGGAALLFDPDGMLVSIGPDIRVWDTSRWGQIGTELYHHDSPVTALAASSDGVLASADERGVIRLWDLSGQQPFGRPLRGHHAAVRALAFSAAGILASGDDDGVVRLWDAATGRELRKPPGPTAPVTSVAFTPDGATLAASYSLGQAQIRRGAQPIQIWDVSAGSVVQGLDVGLGGDVTSVAFGPGGLFASAGVDALAKWDVKTWNYKILVADPRAGPYTAVAFSADGRLLASSAARFARRDDRPVALWRMPDGDQLGEPLDAGRTRAKVTSFRSLAFSPDGSLLAGASEGGVQLWDVSSHEPLGGRLGPAPASSVVVSPDGRTVIAGDADGAVVAYPATIDGWLDTVCALVSRNLTPREWNSYVGSATPYVKTCPQYPAG